MESGAIKVRLPVGGLGESIAWKARSIFSEDVATNGQQFVVGARSRKKRGLGEANGMYLSKPVMRRPSTSVTTRNETVHSVIVQYIHAQDLQATHGRWPRADVLRRASARCTERL